MTRRAAIAAAVLLVVLVVGVARLLGDRPSGSVPPPAVAPASSAAAPASPAPVEPTGEEGDPEAASATPTGPGDASPDGDPYSKTAAARRLWEPVVVGFGKNFTAVDAGAKAWRKGLQPYTTVAVQKQLAGVDVADVPPGRYREFEVLKYEEEQLAVQVAYAEGWSLVLWVISDGEGWHVYRYDRWVE